jgi:hypothetical protein
MGEVVPAVWLERGGAAVAHPGCSIFILNGFLAAGTETAD